MKNSHKKKDKAFTLMELLTVILMISLLSIIGTGVYLGSKKTAARKKMQTVFELLKTGLENYKSDFGEYPVPLGNLGGNSNPTTGPDALWNAMIGDQINRLETNPSNPPRERADFVENADLGRRTPGRYGPCYLQGLYLDNDGILKHKLIELHPTATPTSGRLCFVDPYGEPIGYMSGPRTVNNPTTYDLYIQMGDISVDYPTGNDNWIKNW